ncbi:MAG: hypothetical protein IPG69_11710 [Flavobacteriales bacterium]|nr:hypothetical protein [Flavobacteriales bacterium]
MTQPHPHTFHIPVMGLGYTIDTPIKVARFGISSVVSIIEDDLVERMREFHCKRAGLVYVPIPISDLDHRALRVTAYLNVLHLLVQRQLEVLQGEAFDPGSDIVKYFEMLPDGAASKASFAVMMNLPAGAEKMRLQQELRRAIRIGAIDVNIMSKIDRTNYTKEGEPLPAEYADAMAAFRGFANSVLCSSVVLSAGYNPRLYAYISQFDDFLPDAKGELRKKVVLKVSDLRSALIQGKILAKRGVWVSEFRIESGLNCGGHAFATDGVLLGPILQEFREKRKEVTLELFELCNRSLAEDGKHLLADATEIRITVQGGIGTFEEDRFLRTYYGMDGTGWGSPFLLVPEATNVDGHTLQQLATAKPEDYYMSWSSPLGIPFHNFRLSTSEAQRKARIAKDRPGGPCYKEFLSTDTEFTEVPICTASRQYQDLKIKQLKAKGLTESAYLKAYAAITEKDCLCEGLGASVLLKDGMTPAHKLEAVAICPGPNTAYFSKVVPLGTMLDHIYGRTSLLNTNQRPHMFINEIKLYVQYLGREIDEMKEVMSVKQQRYFEKFKSNLLHGIRYYEELLPVLQQAFQGKLEHIKADLDHYTQVVQGIAVPQVVVA